MRLLKFASVASVIGVTELTGAALTVNAREFIRSMIVLFLGVAYFVLAVSCPRRAMARPPLCSVDVTEGSEQWLTAGWGDGRATRTHMLRMGKIATASRSNLTPRVDAFLRQVEAMPPARPATGAAG